jgi:2-dehydropantoate 2-reductase
VLYKRIAILGAGSMGTLLGACLSKGGILIDLIDINREHVAALNSRGAAISGTVSFTIPVSAITPDRMEGKYDLIFLLTKQTHNASAFNAIRPHLHEKGLVCTLQNGMPEPFVAAAFGESKTIGCAVTWGATYLGPGKTESTTGRENWHSSIGRINGTVDDELKKVQEILELMCHTGIAENLMGMRWSKMLVNCSFSGMSAALGCTFGEILENEKALKCAQHIARECLRVCLAQGITMAPLSPGEDFKLLMDFNTEGERLQTIGIYKKLWGPASSGKASMLQDLENSRKSEIEYINGLLCDTGKKYGVATPVSDKVVEVVLGIENGLYKPGIDNLEMFTRFE